ncbi:MAG TPA: hypothetical protein VGL13_16700, partial [Polyangiaceae bacterium]
VVVPFRSPRSHRRHSSGAWNRPQGESTARGWVNRLATARDMVKAVVETLSYLGDARVRPPLPALPPKRESA